MVRIKIGAAVAIGVIVGLAASVVLTTTARVHRLRDVPVESSEFAPVVLSENGEHSADLLDLVFEATDPPSVWMEEGASVAALSGGAKQDVTVVSDLAATLDIADALLNDTAIIPLQDWIPLFNFTMTGDSNDDETLSAERVLGSLTYVITRGCEPDDDFLYEAIHAPAQSDFMEFGIVRDFGPDGEPDGELNEFDGVGFADGQVLISWDPSGVMTLNGESFQIGEVSGGPGGLVYDMEFYPGYLADLDLDDNFPVWPTAASDPGASYFLVFRTSALWRTATSLGYEAEFFPPVPNQLAVPRLTMVNPALDGNATVGVPPSYVFDVDDAEPPQPIDSYPDPPVLNCLEGAEVRQYSSFGVFDATGGFQILGRNDPDEANAWSWLKRMYTPAAEHIRPRFDGVTQSFDMVTGEWLDLRALFSLETWVPVVGINAHSSFSTFTEGIGGASQILEVNMILTDIGGDPDSPIPGNGGFDPRVGLDGFTNNSSNFWDERGSSRTFAENAIDSDYSFNGVWLFHDTNENGMFDQPVKTADSGVSFTDYPMRPDWATDASLGLIDPYEPGWEYIPRPPWGGDPAWKVRLRFQGDARSNVPQESNQREDVPRGSLDSVPDPDPPTPFNPFIYEDYFVVIRADSGFQDVSLMPGDGTGLRAGADFRAFVEPRRWNDNLTWREVDDVTGEFIAEHQGGWDGGIMFSNQNLGNFNRVIEPNLIENPWQMRDGSPTDNDTGAIRGKWWPQRTLNQNNAKPMRTTVEVHDLVLTYSSNNLLAKRPDFEYVGSTFDRWIDPFGLWWRDLDRFTSFINTQPVQDVDVIDPQLAPDFTIFDAQQRVTVQQWLAFGQITVASVIALSTDDNFWAGTGSSGIPEQIAYETVPFADRIFDSEGTGLGPRSLRFPDPPVQPVLPSFSSWPRKQDFNAGATEGLEDALPSGPLRSIANPDEARVDWPSNQYPRKTDWPQHLRAARLLTQKASNDDPPTAMLGINLVGVDDPVVNRVAQTYLEEITIAFWGPDFMPGDLRALDEDGTNPESGVLLYEDTDTGGFFSGGIFQGAGDPVIDAALGADTPVPLNSLRWESSAEPVDLDGDGLADDLNGDGTVDANNDGEVDEEDKAWVLRLRPKQLWPIPISDERYGGGLGNIGGEKGRRGRAAMKQTGILANEIPEEGVSEEFIANRIAEEEALRWEEKQLAKALPLGGNAGDDLFVVIRPSDTVTRFESVRCFIPWSLPGRKLADKRAGVIISPNLPVPADALEKRNPEENPVQDWYGHDMLEFNVPMEVVNLVLEGETIVPGAAPLAVLGLDVSTNRPAGEARPHSSDERGLGRWNNGLDSYEIGGPLLNENSLVGDFLIDSEYTAFEIVGNEFVSVQDGPDFNALTFRSGSSQKPLDGRWFIAHEPTFLEQIIVEFYDEGRDGAFTLSEDLLPLNFEDPANPDPLLASVSGVALYRDNPVEGMRGRFDPPVTEGGVTRVIDFPVRLDDPPVRIGVPGEPNMQVKFVFSSPGTDNVPEDLEDQPLYRQWVPDSYGGPRPGDQPDFFVVIRASEDIQPDDDFRVGIVGWGPNTPTEPDPDTFTYPPPPFQPADEFDIFSEFAWGARAVGFITFFKTPPIYYFMNGFRALQEPDVSGFNWVRTGTTKRAVTPVITAVEGVDLDFIGVPELQAPGVAVEFTSLANAAMVLSYFWEFGDGETSTEMDPSHAYAEVGTYNVSLTVVDLRDATISLTKLAYIEIIDPELTPFAEFVGNPLVGVLVFDPVLGVDAFDVTFTDFSKGGEDNKPVEWLWDFGDSSASLPGDDSVPVHSYTQEGLYTVKLTTTFAVSGQAEESRIRVEYVQILPADDPVGEGEGEGEGEDQTASFTVEDSIGAGDINRNQHALVPLHDWVPLFNFNMADDSEDAVSPRVLSRLVYSVITDPGAADQPYNVFSGPGATDLLEFGLFADNIISEDDTPGELTEPDSLILTWDNFGAPVGELTNPAQGNLIYDLDFIGTGIPANPEFPVVQGPAPDGQTYIVAVRTSATWRHAIGMSYQVLLAEMFPFPLNDDGTPADTYSPDFFAGEIFETDNAYSSSFTVYDVSSRFSVVPDADVSNVWNVPVSLYTPQAEYSRPRFDLGQDLFDFVGGQIVNFREVVPLDSWKALIGINMHSTVQPLAGGHVRIFTLDEPPQPVTDLREVNVVFTDIGADPFGPKGNGGFDPREGLENFTNSSSGIIGLAIGRDYAFNGAWVFEDTNNNGVFDAPTPDAGGGVTMTDQPLFFDWFSGQVPEWEYIPFPPGGGDPWWKIKLRFFNIFGQRDLGDDIGHLENVPEDNEAELEDDDGLFGNPSERVDYFVVVRTDSGYRDVSLAPGDGDGLTPGADFKAFIEPRRWDASKGSFEGGIYVDSMIPASDFFSGQTPWQDDPRWGDTEPWWPQRTQNDTNVKPVRLNVEVHDLVMTYVPIIERTVIPDMPFNARAFTTWMDPFGLTSGQFLNGSDAFALFASFDFMFDFDGFLVFLDNRRSLAAYPAFETVPFFNPAFDGPPNGPRSDFFPEQLLIPSLPEFVTWPGTLAPGAYPHLTNWAAGDRQARLLKQRVDAVSEPTALLGFNLVGSSDPEVNRVVQMTLDSIDVALWGPDFDPSDLLPLDPEGDDVDSGALLWADSTTSGTDGVFLGRPVPGFLEDPFLLDALVPLVNLAWGREAEPIDLDGDGSADDLNGDGFVDARDRAWVLTLVPAAPISLVDNDDDFGDQFNEGDDYFFVIRTSKRVSRFEQIRAVVPASLPGRPVGQRQSGIRVTPQGFVSGSALAKSNPEESVAFDFYGHDMLEVNVPTEVLSMIQRNTQLAPSGPPVPAFGLDISTNRVDGTVDSGTAGTGGIAAFVDTAKAWEPGSLAGKWLVDSGYETFSIVTNTPTRLTLLNGMPRSGGYFIVKDPTFLEQVIVEFFRTSETSTFRFSTDLLPLNADQAVSGVALYRDNDFHPENRNGVFDSGIDIPLVLDDAPVIIGTLGKPETQVKFVFSSPGTDDWPVALQDQPRLRQWVPNSFGIFDGDQFTGPDFFVVVRASSALEDGDDFGVAIASWGPPTPTEPDPDTFTFPAPPVQSAGEFNKFSEFPFGSRALGFITFFEEPPTRYWMRGAEAFSEPEPGPTNWIRTTTSKKVQSGTITARDELVSPTTITIDSVSESEIPVVIVDGPAFNLVVRGDNFGTAPEVVIGGYDVEVLSARDEAIEVSLRNREGVIPQEPVVIIVRNLETDEERSREDLLTLSGVHPDFTRVLNVSPSRGGEADFPVTITGLNFAPLPYVEVLFNETVMPIRPGPDDGTELVVDFPVGGLPATGALDVTVRNFDEKGRPLSQDTRLGAFTFVNGPMSPCFIATAAYGSPLDAHLKTFRGFRDGVLLKSALGAAAVDVYYTVSPPIADQVAAHGWLAWLVRAILTPVAWVLRWPLLLAVPLGLVLIRRRGVRRRA